MRLLSSITQNCPLFALLPRQRRPARTPIQAIVLPTGCWVERLQSEYGLEALNNLEGKHRTMRGFKIAYGKLGQEIWTAWHRVLQLEKRRAAVPRRVPVQDAMDKPVVQLAPERKHLTNLVKMVASLSSRSPTASRVAGRGEGAGENGGSMNGVGPAS